MDDKEKGEAVQNAAVAGAAAGSAARGAMEFGSMGLRGIMQIIGNASGMMIVAVMMIIMYRDLRSLQTAEQTYQREEMRRIQQEAAADRNRLWEANSSAHRDLRESIRSVDTKVEKLLQKGP